MVNFHRAPTNFHQEPIPRGGGAAIVIAFALAVFVLFIANAISAQWTLAILGAGATVALVGFVDDHSPIPARVRFVAHCIASAWVLYWMGTPLLDLPGGALDLGVIGFALCTVYLVWMLNLYNFMDGIDGIGSTEAITVTLSGAALSMAVNPGSAVVAPALLLAAAAVGFLVWNFPPAKIFMGDAGSGFLGIILGTLSLMAALEAPVLFWIWVILLGMFVVDATVTLFRRLARRERLYEAHRSHAYQFASRRLGAHRPVSIAVGLINLFWLLPIASIVAASWVSGAAGVIIAYTPLVGLALYLKAGTVEPQSS